MSEINSRGFYLNSNNNNMPNKHHITPHNVNLYVVSAVPQCTYVYTGANNLCCSTVCCWVYEECVSTWATGTSCPYLYVKRVKTNQELNLIALILLCQNWQVSESLAEHLIVFQNIQKKLNLFSSVPILNRLISPFHVAGSVQKESYVPEVFILGHLVSLL